MMLTGRSSTTLSLAEMPPATLCAPRASLIRARIRWLFRSVFSASFRLHDHFMPFLSVGCTLALSIPRSVTVTTLSPLFCMTPSYRGMARLAAVKCFSTWVFFALVYIS